MSGFVIKQHQTYYARLDVPVDVRSSIGKAAFKQTLKTSDLKLATERAALLVAQWKVEIRKARNNSTDWEEGVISARDEILTKKWADQHEKGNAMQSLFDAVLQTKHLTQVEDINRLDQVIKTGAPSTFFKSSYIDRFESLSLY